MKFSDFTGNWRKSFHQRSFENKQHKDSFSSLHVWCDLHALASFHECFQDACSRRRVLFHSFWVIKKWSNSAVVGYQTRGSEKSESVSHETLECFDELLAEREWTQPSNILPQHSLGPPQPWHGCWWNTIFTIRKGPGPPHTALRKWGKKKTLGQYKGAL